MNKPFNKLSDAEAERLAILAEECAEVIKCVGKILRHGYEGFDPTGKENGSNRQQLSDECGQIFAEIDNINSCLDLDIQWFNDGRHERYRRILDSKYRHHQ